MARSAGVVSSNLRVGQILNQTELGRDVGLPQPTVHRWLNLLETSYLLVRLPAYAVNRTKRLLKSPKIFWCDNGVALHLGGSSPEGAHLENLVLHDLLAWRDARVDRAELTHWRATIGEDVYFVIESGGLLLPVEVKATAKPGLGDCAHLRTFRQEYGHQARAGLPLHTGHKTGVAHTRRPGSPVVAGALSWRGWTPRHFVSRDQNSHVGERRGSEPANSKT